MMAVCDMDIPEMEVMQTTKTTFVWSLNYVHIKMVILAF